MQEFDERFFLFFLCFIIYNNSSGKNGHLVYHRKMFSEKEKMKYEKI